MKTGTLAMASENTKKSKISAFMQRIQPDIAAILPQTLDKQRYATLTSLYLVDNPDLLGCDEKSLRSSILQAAAMGLEIGSPLNHASLLPFKTRGGGLSRAQLIIEYRGYILLCYRSGKMLALSARAVFENDNFDYRYGSESFLYHKPARNDKGRLIAAYAIAYLYGNQIDFEVIDSEGAAQARQDSPGANHPDSLWNKRPAAMWIKTAIRRLSNRLPQSGEDNFDMRNTGPKKDMVATVDYQNYLKAIENAPDLHQEAKSILNIDSPQTLSECRSITQLMRHLYKAKSSTKN
jgi:recombination protein RecT